MLLKIKVIIVNFRKDIKLYSFPVAFAHAMYFLFSDVRNTNNKKSNRFFRWGEEIRNRSVERFLKKKYRRFLDDYKTKIKLEKDACITPESPIWVLWWQGADQMPEIIRLCTESKKKNCGKHPVIILTQENYQDYIQLPEYVLDKFAAGKISVTHLSDMLRVSILARHGGIWLDASILCVQGLPEDVVNRNLFTCKNRNTESSNISKNRWSTYAIGSALNNPLLMFIRDFFFEYCKDYDQFIDYFLFDHIINLAYSEFEVIRKMIDDVPYNNEQCETMTNLLNQAYSEETMKHFLNQKDFLYKIAWKQEFYEQVHGQMTLYSYIKNMYKSES